MRVIAALLLAAALSACMSAGNSATPMPDPAAHGGGIAGSAPVVHY